MEDRLAITLDVLQSLMASIGEEVSEMAAVRPGSLLAIEREMERQRKATFDLLGVAGACAILARRQGQI